MCRACAPVMHLWAELSVTRGLNRGTQAVFFVIELMQEWLLEELAAAGMLKDTVTGYVRSPSHPHCFHRDVATARPCSFGEGRSQPRAYPLFACSSTADNCCGTQETLPGSGPLRSKARRDERKLRLVSAMYAVRLN